MSIKKLVVASNMYQEIDRLPGWFEFVHKIADGGILIVDSGSKDGTVEYAEKEGAVVVVDDIIQREGYGPARNQLRELAKRHFPDSDWLVFFDADELVMEEDFHQLRFLKDYLVDTYDVIAFPRIDWKDIEMKEAANDVMVSPDWQGRMSRLDSPLRYIRMLHEQIEGCRGIHTSLNNPKIHHFHRCAPSNKRELVGKLCAKLHSEDEEWGTTYPKHPKEDEYLERYKKEGL